MTTVASVIEGNSTEDATLSAGQTTPGSSSETNSTAVSETLTTASPSEVHANSTASSTVVGVEPGTSPETVPETASLSLTTSQPSMTTPLAEGASLAPRSSGNATEIQDTAAVSQQTVTTTGHELSRSLAEEGLMTTVSAKNESAVTGTPHEGARELPDISTTEGSGAGEDVTQHTTERIHLL